LADWSFLISSEDGTRLLASGVNPAPSYTPGPIYTSTNSGITWRSNNLPNLYWSSATTSADGLKLAVCAEGDGIYTSIDGGFKWMLNNVANAAWSAIASSADGERLVATVNNGGIFVSTNAGTNWTEITAPNQPSTPIFTYKQLASSADGTHLVDTDVEAIYVSTNSGAAWTQTEMGMGDWSSVALSADGSVCVAVDEFAPRVVVFKSTPPVPVLNIVSTNNNAVLSWIIPSINYALQEDADLTSTNWSDVGGSLTFTNLQYQETLPISSNQMFYRLVSR
jgi:hypothetical protein